jgi:predicted MPP superfamily phosphohydrolase
MAKFAWATDIHLDHLGDDKQRIIQFGESLVAQGPTGIFLTGDLSVARLLAYHLGALEQIAKRPIYFVLGNHDYYGARVQAVRDLMKNITNASPFLRYMPTVPYVALNGPGLSGQTAVLGHDGWYDALYGDAQNSNFKMTDWHAIHDFIEVNGSKANIVALARKYALEDVTAMQNSIKQAVRYHKNLVILTHYPPFAQSHLHEGKLGDRDAMPWFTCKMMGDMLLDASKAYPNVKFTVLAGHTHGKYDGKITNNLEVHVGGAEYGRPALQGLIDVP